MNTSGNMSKETVGKYINDQKYNEMKKLLAEPDKACPGLVKISLFSLELNEKPNESGRFATVIMPFKYTDEKENFLYAWRAFLYGKKIEIFC